MTPIDSPQWDNWTEDEPDFEIPGIDDCSHLFTLSDGDGSLYIRIQEHPGEPGIFYASATIDSEAGAFVEDLETMAGPYDSPAHALKDLAHHASWFDDNPGEDAPEWDTDAQEILSA